MSNPPVTADFEPERNFSQELICSLAAALLWLLRLARYAYFLRVPILIGAFFGLFPFLALAPSSPLRALFQNLFFLEQGGSHWPTFWSTIAALVLAWSLLLTSRIVLLNCGDRFNIPSRLGAANLSGWPFFAILVVAIPAIAGQFTQQNDFRPGQGFCSHCLWAVLAGGLTAYLLAFAALWVAVLIAPPNTQGSALTFPCISWMRRQLKWADEHHLLPKGLGLGIWIRKNLPCGLWRGYLASDGFVWSGEWLAFLFAITTLGLYFFVDWWHKRALGQPSGVTALTFVLLLLVNANWVLSFAAFFLDRFRIPLLVPLALLALISGNFRSSDHYFRVIRSPSQVSEIVPARVLEARRGKPIVVIATAGGGIQAAAWTTQVLAGVETAYQRWFPGETFAEHVAAISSISGGATGAMFYLNLYDAAVPHHFRSAELASLTDLASRSSLDDVAWALVYRDLPRIIVPPAERTYDRGYVLEKTWSDRARLTQDLSQWRIGLLEGWRPAAIFNATIAETGEPLAFATTAWSQELDPRTGKPFSPRRRDFYEMYAGQDLSVTTAVRMAASFPYVTPAARPDTADADADHMIDGGYYDNYGVSSLIAWLDQGLTELQAKCESNPAAAANKPNCELPQILFVQIRSFPSDQEPPPVKRGWAFQLYAPIKGLLSVRTTAQSVRDREALAMFSQKWQSATNIQFATFEFGTNVGPTRDKAINPPLSWAMNPAQLQSIRDEWNWRFDRPDSAQNDANIKTVHCFFVPRSGDCMEGQLDESSLKRMTQGKKLKPMSPTMNGTILLPGTSAQAHLPGISACEEGCCELDQKCYAHGTIVCSSNQEYRCLRSNRWSALNSTCDVTMRYPRGQVCPAQRPYWRNQDLNGSRANPNGRLSQLAIQLRKAGVVCDRYSDRVASRSCR